MPKSSSLLPPEVLLTKPSDYPTELFVIPLLAFIIGIIYSIIIYQINFEPLLVGPAAAVYVSVFFPAKFIILKKSITKYGKTLMIGTLAVLLLFLSNYATRSYLLYNDFLKEEILYEKEEEIYVSDLDAQQFLEQALAQETGFSGYTGAFIWNLQNTEISGNNNDDMHSVGFREAVGIEVVSLLACLALIIFGLPMDMKKRELALAKT